MRFRWLPVSSGYSPPDSLHPAKTFVITVCSPVCIFDLSNQSPVNFRCLAIGPCSIELSASSRVRTNLAANSSPTELRVQPIVSSFRSSFEELSFETQARAIQDISRSRVREFTLFRNTSKGNTRWLCGFPV